MGKDVRGSAGVEGARRATGASAGRGRGGRFSVRRKREAVLLHRLWVTGEAYEPLRSTAVRAA